MKFSPKKNFEDTADQISSDEIGDFRAKILDYGPTLWLQFNSFSVILKLTNEYTQCTQWMGASLRFCKAPSNLG